MRLSRIYLNQALESQSQVSLDREKSHYLVTVLRLSTGTPLQVFNGQGGCYEAEITEASKNRCSILLGKHLPDDRQSPASIDIGIGLSRPEKVDFILQKCTELGATSFTPVITTHSEFRLKGEKLEKKLSHWEKVIISACEQSQRNRLPLLKPVCRQLGDYLDARPEGTIGILLDHRSELSLVSTLEKLDKPEPAFHLLIGPEGGLSEHEIEAGASSGFLKAHLGPRVLRTETAPVAAMAILQSRVGDFR